MSLATAARIGTDLPREFFQKLAREMICGDFIAHSSHQVTGNAVAMGEAAGVAAALAAKTNRRLQDIPFSEIGRTLGSPTS